MDDDLAQVATAWRELRRGASAAALRRMLHTTSAGVLDLGQVDTLELLVAGGVRMNELAGLLRVDASTATRAVQRLVDVGLADRQPDECDKRGVVIRATSRGEAIMDEIRLHGRAALERMTSSFTPGELHQLSSLMGRFVDALDELVAEAGATACAPTSADPRVDTSRGRGSG